MNDRTVISDSNNRRFVAGRYELEKKLGGGGMGQVYLARQVSVGNRVAIKFLAPQLCHDEMFVKRFLQEARVSLEVTHPGAAQLLDTGREEDGQLFIVFELVEGEDLRQRLERDGALGFREAKEIILKIGEVLAFAHGRGVVHRDIKPENVRIRKDLAGTHVKVLDFGIARLTQDAGARLTTEGGIAGTPQYMAPEQIRAEDVDARTDLYAVGLLLFEMVSGRPAFVAGSTHALMFAQVNDPLPRIKDVQPGRDFPELDEVLQKACAKNRADRYANMSEFISALQALPEPQWGRAPTPLPPPKGPPVVPVENRATPMPGATQVTSGPLPWLALGGILVAALAGGAAVKLFGQGPAVATPPVAAHPWGCVELDYFDPSLTRLDIPELEERVRHSRITPPSAAKKQLESLRASTENMAPDHRGCFYRAALVGSVASEATVLKTVPEQWGQAHEVEELKTLFLEMPLKQKWDLQQRRKILDTIENLFIANLRKDDPEDGDYWRRMYFGIELTCEATDAALEKLGAKRSKSCLNLSP